MVEEETTQVKVPNKLVEKAIEKLKLDPKTPAVYVTVAVYRSFLEA